EKAGTVDAHVERLQRGKGVLYWQCPRGESLDTPVAKLLAKVRYKSSTTTRNLRTVEKLLAD
ncbi:MAG: pyridoxamine 5-phosphate oxidase, partial [Comamonadaceae bacterium]